jgi:hypothetical protein
MDFLIIVVAMLGLILAKALLTRKESHYRHVRAHRKIDQLVKEADRRNSQADLDQVAAKHKTKPPPLPASVDA